MDFDGLGFGHSQGLEGHAEGDEHDLAAGKMRPFVATHDDSVFSGAACEDMMISLAEFDKVKMIAY